MRQHNLRTSHDRTRTFDRIQLPHVPETAPKIEGTDIPVEHLLIYMTSVQNLYAFLSDFPEVAFEDSLTAIREHVRTSMPVHSDRGRVSGVPVFKGSRVPMRDLFGQIAEGGTVDDYLENFPSAGREQVIQVLEMASMLMEAMAYENSAR